MHTAAFGQNPHFITFCSRWHQWNTSDHKVEDTVISSVSPCFITFNFSLNHHKNPSNKMVYLGREKDSDSSAQMLRKLSFSYFSCNNSFHSSSLINVPYSDRRACVDSVTAVGVWWPTVCSFPNADGASPSSNPAPPARRAHSPLGFTPRRNPVPPALQFSLPQDGGSQMALLASTSHPNRPLWRFCRVRSGFWHVFCDFFPFVSLSSRSGFWQPWAPARERRRRRRTPAT